jgi:hypothetical protein
MVAKLVSSHVILVPRNFCAWSIGCVQAGVTSMKFHKKLCCAETEVQMIPVLRSTCCSVGSDDISEPGVNEITIGEVDQPCSFTIETFPLYISPTFQTIFSISPFIETFLAIATASSPRPRPHPPPSVAPGALFPCDLSVTSKEQPTINFTSPLTTLHHTQLNLHTNFSP